MMRFGFNSHRNTCDQCMRCGRTHVYGSCRAYNAKCNKCHRIGHFARVCRSRNTKVLKSTRTKQRDMQRMSDFIRKKTAECNFPFQDEDVNFLRNQEFNSLNHRQQQSAISTLQNQNKVLQKKICSLKDEVQTSKSELKDTTRTLKERNEHIAKLNQQIEDLSFNLTACKQQNNSFLHTINELRMQNEALERRVTANLEFQRTVPQISHKRELYQQPLAENGNHMEPTEEERLIKKLEELTQNCQILSEKCDQSARPKHSRHRGGRQQWKWKN